MVIGIRCLLGGLLYIIIGSAVDKATTHELPPFESDKEFWDYHLKLSGIADPAERRKFEREYIQKKKKEKAGKRQ